MSISVVSTYTNVLSTDKKFVGGLHDLVYRKDGALIGRVIPLRGYKAGTGVEIPIITAANGSAEVYTEGMSMPAAGQQTTSKATFAFKHFRVVVGETLHAMRARGPQGQGLRDGVDPKFDLTLAVKDLRTLMTTTFTAAGQIYSIDGIIDNDGTNFGNVDRSVTTVAKSYVLDASSAALSTALLNKANHRSKSSPYGAAVEAWISEGIQEGAVAELGSGKLALPTASGMVDVIPGNVGAAQRPWVFLPGLATSIVLGMTDIDGSWGYTSNEVGNLPAMDGSGFYFHQLGSNDSSVSASIETAGAIWCTQPQRQVRIESLSVS